MMGIFYNGVFDGGAVGTYVRRSSIPSRLTYGTGGTQHQLVGRTAGTYVLQTW
jgi:hypothetical protein